jgi:rod shape-determining protein MreD
MKIAAVFLALAVALALQTTLAGLTMSGVRTVNLVLIVVVFAALAYGPVTGLMSGVCGGLVQDALAGGTVGLGSLSKTIVGFIVGVLGAQFIVSQPIPRFVMFAGATVLHELSYQALSAVVEVRGMRFQYSIVLTQAVVNAVLGVLAFGIVERGPGLMQRRYARRSTLSSKRF